MPCRLNSVVSVGHVREVRLAVVARCECAVHLLTPYQLQIIQNIFIEIYILLYLFVLDILNESYMNDKLQRMWKEAVVT